MGTERDDYFRHLPGRTTALPVSSVRIGDRLVGEGQPVYVIAEASANHRGRIENAFKLIDEAAQAGADAIKFQHLKAKGIASDAVFTDSWHGKPIGQLSAFYKPAELPYEWTERLLRHSESAGIQFLSTPFDVEAADLLDSLNVPAFKVASYELTDDVLLQNLARRKKPLILSTGMAYLEEVAHAIRLVQEEGNDDIVILHCVSLYPPRDFSDVNLRAIATLRDAFKLPVGYSDHSRTPYVAAPLAAVALGACVIEKHLTDSREGGSADDPNSMLSGEFARMVEEIRNVEKAISGSGIKQPVSYEGHAGDELYDRFSRRSLHARISLKAGQILTEDSLVTLRPTGGLEPRFLKLIVGKAVIRDVEARAPIRWEDLLQGD